MGSCIHHTVDDEAYFDDFTRRAGAQRVPLDGSLELTHRCNLRCVHCYLGDQKKIRPHRRDELSTAEIKQLLDELATAGTLNFTFTGGDPMLRKDFPELYEYAVRKGFLVTIFCDGALISPKVMAIFDRFAPRKVEVSIYGATAQTYEDITQVKGSYQRCIDGLDALKSHGFRFTLKTVLMQGNRHELEQMRDLADQYGVPFYFDTAIFPCLPHADNGKSAAPANGIHGIPVVLGNARQAVTNYRIDPEEAAKLHLRDPRRVEEMADLYVRSQKFPKSDDLYKCSAGKSTFHIDPYGNLQACTISTNGGYNIREGGFMAGWNGPIAALRSRKARPGSSCSSCDKQALCGGCPAFFYAENNAGDVKSNYTCETTHLIVEGLSEAIRARMETSE